MPPKFRTSKRKEFFRTPENLQQLSGHETAAPLHCNENEGTSRSNQCKKRVNEDNPDCIDVCDVNGSVSVTSCKHLCFSTFHQYLPRLFLTILAFPLMTCKT